MKDVLVYDTTLRDGCQAENVTFSGEDKLRVARTLDALGVDFIEGGWPNETNPRDREFFARAADESWQNARLAAFGSTRRANLAPEDDTQLQQLVASGAPVITIFGKAWTLHATEILRITLEENLALIEDSVAWLKAQGRTVFFDAEHFFDGYRADSAYALETLRAAQRGGADALIPCDTNGGSLPLQIQEIMSVLVAEFTLPLGIHAHNDAGMADANSLLAVTAGATQVQGTINGYGERAGNANLCTILPNLELKMGKTCLPEGKLAEITYVSAYVSELANLPHNTRLPYVGRSAFAHKGGMHVNAVMKDPVSFEHIPPETVGNERRILVSDQAGRSTILHKLQTMYPRLSREDPLIQTVLQEVKERENRGYEYEAADASLALLARKLKGELPDLFQLHGFRVMVEKHDETDEPFSEATIRIRVNDARYHTAAEGNGPVNALDKALRKALRPKYPELDHLELVDYKVRVLEGTVGTATPVRVLIQTTDGEETWGTVGVHENMIQASWEALVDAIIYGLHKHLRKRAEVQPE
ncbi:MAG TPA: citramalate synthase [Armatimonadota bacterium]|jgi:2-isopropylmalate synthase